MTEMILFLHLIKPHIHQIAYQIKFFFYNTALEVNISIYLYAISSTTYIDADTNISAIRYCQLVVGSSCLTHSREGTALMVK